MSEKMPLFFIGHGSPMNAIEMNPFTRSLKEMRQLCPNPKAILCISAHWMTEGTWVTHMSHPKTIHDFYGFPKALSDITYPAPGDPQLAELIHKVVEKSKINLDNQMWGLDHGTWSVLRHMYPEAKIPVVQLSINSSKPAAYHFELGQQLRKLRTEGILIIGSGNIVHNLEKIRWEPDAKPYDWAVEFDLWVKNLLEKRDFDALMNLTNFSESGKLSVPTVDHYYPLLYVLGASDENDVLTFNHDEIQNGSISMRTFTFQQKPSQGRGEK